MIMGVVLATLLISTVSAMVIAGPRVLQVIGEDFRLFRFLSRLNDNQIPMVAIIVQSGLTLFFILTSTFESVLIFSGFVMGVNTFFAVAGVFVLRRRGTTENAYKTWGYPVTPLIFLGLMAWTLIYILINRPQEGIAGLVIIAIGALLYVVSERANKTAD
jgi:APA family basic amino acid/polyamine antiporter